MSLVKSTLVALALATASVAPAFAGDGGMDDGMAWALNIDGTYSTGKLNAKGMTEMMKMAKPLPGGVTIFRSNGKLYMIDDPKGSVYQMRRDMMIQGM
jgi:hypothetical protein